MGSEVIYQYRVQIWVTLRKGECNQVGGGRKLIETVTIKSPVPMMKAQILAHATQVVNELTA